MPASSKLVEQANRQLGICNACRYCEGLCPVFRAIEIRRDFAPGDIFYLANLCHDCRSCYYACMFSPPHEFAINIPQLLSQARTESYRNWSWPGLLAAAFEQPKIGWLLSGLAVSVVAIVALLALGPSRLVALPTGPGAFYALVPYAGMVIPALGLVLFAAAIWFRGAVRFWSDTNGSTRLSGKPMLEALGAVLTLRHLQGGGPGCSYPEERPSRARRVYHALVFWGFLADLVSTTLAFLYQDFLHELPPYRLGSAPVVFGSIGGLLLLIGTAGLVSMKRQSDRAPALARATGLDYVFLTTLGLVALTGMLTLAFRATSALGSLLVVHLAFVAAFFVTAPYGKFVHALYRSLALLRYYAEGSKPTQTP